MELLQLKAKHYEQGLETEDEYQVSYDVVNLENRKGWTRKSSGNVSAVKGKHIGALSVGFDSSAC